MDRLHQTLTSIRTQTKADSRPLSVFREFLSHLGRLAGDPPRRSPRVKAGAVRKAKRGGKR